MEQRVKRFKPTKESMVADIASSIDHMTNSIKSISESYCELLRVNKAVVAHLQNAEKREAEINLDQTVANLERSSIRETQ